MKNAYNTMKTLKSLLIISLVFVLCGSCKTHRDKAKKENEIFQQGQYTNKFQQVSQVAADIIHKLKLSTRRALVISQPNTSSNSVTSGTEQIIIPAPQLMSDGYTYIIRINHTTRQYWWTKQGGISGIIERYGPIQYQDKESDKASETINTNSVSVVMHPNYPNKGMPIALASINQHKPCSDILLFTGFALTNEFSKSISTILNKFNINAQCFDVPVIYETYWGINFLSKSFQAEIKSSADTISGSGTKFWFVLVLSFQYYVDFTVYLKPDIVTPRLRKGNKLDVFEISERKRWEHLDLPFLSPYYYQVSLLLPRQLKL